MNLFNDYFDELTSENFLIYATKKYDRTTSFGLSELNSDLERFMAIKRALRKYKRNKDVNVRLLLNHFVILNNLFGPFSLNRMLFFYVDNENILQVITILEFLNILYPYYYTLPEYPFWSPTVSSSVEVDEYLFETLNNL